MIYLPWQAWYGDTHLEVAFPEGWDVACHTLPPRPGLSVDRIRAAFRVPLGTPPLAALAAASRDAAVVVEDITRPLPTAEILPHLLSELARGGLGPERVKIIMGLGNHPTMARPALLKKLGAWVLDRYTVYQHTSRENLDYLGETRRGTPVYIDRFWNAAELRIALGTVMPHAYVGFSGGAKLVAVGLGGIESIRANHARVEEMGGAGRVEACGCRQDMEEIAEMAGLGFLVNGIVDARRQVVALYAGEPRQVHSTAIRQLCDWYTIQLPQAVDVAVFNAYPKDTDALQISNALNAAGPHLARLIRPGGAIVITAACSEGLGWHALNSPGMSQEFVFDRQRDFGGREFIVVTPNLSRPEYVTAYPADGCLVSDWPSALDMLVQRYGQTARAAVFTAGPLMVGRM